jgi:hypothetical protein
MDNREDSLKSARLTARILITFCTIAVAFCMTRFENLTASFVRDAVIASFPNGPLAEFHEVPMPEVRQAIINSADRDAIQRVQRILDSEITSNGLRNIAVLSYDPAQAQHVLRFAFDRFLGHGEVIHVASFSLLPQAIESLLDPSSWSETTDGHLSQDECCDGNPELQVDSDTSGLSKSARMLLRKGYSRVIESPVLVHLAGDDIFSNVRLEYYDESAALEAVGHVSVQLMRGLNSPAQSIQVRVQELSQHWDSQHRQLLHHLDSFNNRIKQRRRASAVFPYTRSILPKMQSLFWIAIFVQASSDSSDFQQLATR